MADTLRYLARVVLSEGRDGYFPFDRCPMHFSSIPVVVIECSVQANTVIPDGDRMRLPPQATAKHFLGQVSNEEFE